MTQARPSTFRSPAPLGARRGPLRRRIAGEPMRPGSWTAPTRATQLSESRGGLTSVLLRRWPWMALVTMLVVLGAAWMSWSRIPMYTTSADVLVPPRVLAAGTAPVQPDMGSEVAVAKSAAVIRIAAQALGQNQATAAQGVSVSVPLNTRVVRLTDTSSDPATAQRRAQAFANAYVTYWRQQQSEIDQQVSKRWRSGLTATVISAATLPTSPSSPNHMIDVSVAIVIGLTLGVGTAWIRDRVDDGLRGSADLGSHARTAVLATIPAFRRRHGEHPLITVAKPFAAASLAYQQLRRTTLRLAAERSAKTLLVTTPVGDRNRFVAANTAVAMARTLPRVILVCADPHTAERPHPLDIPSGPGLGDVLERRASLASALHPCAVANLQVLPFGTLVNDPVAAFDGPAMRQVFRQLRAMADFVVVDGSGVLVDPYAAYFADSVEMILLVADGARTTRREVSAGRAWLDQFEDRLIGCALDDAGPRVGHREAASQPAGTAWDGEPDGEHRPTPAHRAGDHPAAELTTAAELAQRHRHDGQPG